VKGFSEPVQLFRALRLAEAASPPAPEAAAERPLEAAGA
jgi:hypothetical protein